MIATGYGVEHLLTDAMSRRIIERDIIPYFKRNDYYGGLNRGADAIFEVLKGEYQGTRKSSGGGFPVGVIFFLIIIFIIILISYQNTNAMVVMVIILMVAVAHATLRSHYFKQFWSWWLQT